MINLLPAEQKEKLFLEKKEKLIMNLGFVVLLSLACLILILLAIRFYLLIITDYQKGVLQQTKSEIQTADFTNFNNIINKYNGTLLQLSSFYKKETYYNQVFNVIEGVSTPSGLYITNFSLSRSATGKVKVIVSGDSDSRDNLIIFKKNIESNKEVENPYFSPESWTSPRNVNFTLTFEISLVN